MTEINLIIRLYLQLMILIADSGSSKTIWRLLLPSGETATCLTSGINPFYLDTADIISILQAEYTLMQSGITAIFFYGAGCIPDKKAVLWQSLHDFFGIERIEINSDLLGTARAMCRNKPGIACILGTGSNSCYYDGTNIVENVPPLGYVLGNEGGGDVLGKKLLSDVLKKQLPETIRDAFFSSYQLSVEKILEHIYRQPFPNRFLASFTHFIAAHITVPELEHLVEHSFREFFIRNVLQYQQAKMLPVYFTGSVAYIFQRQLYRVAEALGIEIKDVAQTPMEGLVEYHLKLTIMK
jgi:N-acetylglucosamine kinase-like BadF-type ATPase